MSKEQLGKPLGEAFVVKSRIPAASVALGILGTVIAIIAAITVVAEHSGAPGIAACAVGSALALIGLVTAFTKRKRWRIALHENGAVIQAKGNPPAEVLFAELAALSHEPKPHYSNGVYAGIMHTLRFWRKEDQPKMPYVQVACYISAKKNEGEAEAMQALADKATEVICDRLTAVVDGGGTVKSPGGLQVNAHGVRFQGTSIALGEIAELGVFDGKFCIWKTGEEFATLKIDPGAANVLPIMNIVSRKLADHDKQVAEEESGTLGRVLFERRQSKVFGWILILIGIPATVVLVGLLLIYVGLRLVRGYFRCHERGVSQRAVSKEKRLLYTQVSSFTYSATRMYYNGAYTGTALVMNFQTEDPKQLPPIKFTTSIKNQDDDLDELRDRISVVVAQRLLKEFAESEVFTWTKGLEVTKDGIRYRKGKLLGKGEWVLLPFEQYQGVNIQEGTFHLFKDGADKSVYHCLVGEPNFFPGLHAFLTIVNPGEDVEIPEDEGADESEE
jgi:hypothetical protein